jgi:hypothetical protein
MTSILVTDLVGAGGVTANLAEILLVEIQQSGLHSPIKAGDIPRDGDSR